MGRTERMGTSINLVAENPRPRDGHAICAEPELLQFRDGLRVVRIIVVCHGGVLEIMHVAFVVGLEMRCVIRGYARRRDVDVP